MNNFDIEEVVNKLKILNLKVGFVESLTAGLMSATLANYSGVSSFYRGSLVTYASEVKEDVLDIKHEFVEKYGVVSKEIAYLMAKGGARVLKADVVVSFTGNAGPTGMENKPVGLVYIAIYYKGEIKVYEYHFKGDRDQIRHSSVVEGFKLLKKFCN